MDYLLLLSSLRNYGCYGKLYPRCGLFHASYCNYTGRSLRNSNSVAFYSISNGKISSSSHNLHVLPNFLEHYFCSIDNLLHDSSTSLQGQVWHPGLACTQKLVLFILSRRAHEVYSDILHFPGGFGYCYKLFKKCAGWCFNSIFFAKLYYSTAKPGVFSFTLCLNILEH